MAVPKATMDKYHFAPANEYQVRISRKVSSVQPKAIAKFVNELSHHDLWGCIL